MFQAVNKKYGSPPSPPPVTKERYEKILKSVDPWRSSEAIIELSNHLKANRPAGIHLVLLDGRPCLHFEPGLDYSNPDRFQIAEDAYRKLLAAKDDMEGLIARGLLAIPNHPGFNR